MEAVCNAIAAEFLVPQDAFLRAWKPNESLDVNAEQLAKHFRVSRIVIAVRARVLNRITKKAFDQFHSTEQRGRQKQRKRSSGGGDFYRTARARNGNAFVRAVLGSAASGELLYRNAGRLLSMSPKNVREAYRRQEGGA